MHWCSGKQTWSHESFASTLNLDLEKGHDLLQSELFLCLLEAAINNAFDGMIGGSPCRTFTRLRHGDTQDDGPVGCRTRFGIKRFGVEGLSEEDQKKVDGDTVLLLRFIVLTEIMQTVKQMRGSKPGFVLFEHPADPASYVQTKVAPPKEKEFKPTSIDPYPSVWAWAEVEGWIERLGLHQIRCDQGALGGSSVKPTTLVTTSGFLWEKLHGMVVPLSQLWSVFRGLSLGQRMQASKSHAQWAPEMVREIRAALRHWKVSEDPHKEDFDRLEAIRALVGFDVEASQVGLSKLLSRTCSPSLCRAKAESERNDWISHCQRGHIPWRRDCAACVQAAAYPRPHRRQRHPAILNLQADLAGPFILGEDIAIQRPKHLMICTYAFPLFESEYDVEEVDNPDGCEIPTEFMAEDFEGPLSELDPPEDQDEPEGGDTIEEPTLKELETLQTDKDKWDDIIKSCKSRYKTVTLTFVEILPDKKASTVVSALSRVYSKLRAQGFPVMGLFTDRGGEFINKSVRVWAEARDLKRLTTMPESPASNGRCERALGLLKRGIRGLLQAHALSPTFGMSGKHCIGQG